MPIEHCSTAVTWMHQEFARRDNLVGCKAMLQPKLVQQHHLQAHWLIETNDSSSISFHWITQSHGVWLWNSMQNCGCIYVVLWCLPCAAYIWKCQIDTTLCFLPVEKTCKASIKQAPTMDHAGKQIHTISMCKKHAAMKAQPWQTNKHAAIMAQPIASIQPSRPNLCRQPSSLQAQPIHIVKHYT